MIKEIMIMLIGATPVLELRWAIPQALYWNMPVLKAFYLSVLGNIIIIAPVLFFLEPVSNRLRKFKIWSRFFDWLNQRTMKKADMIQKYEALGLIMFVAIPFPGTGAWTGCLAASMFKIRFRYAFPAVILGIIIAGVIVTLLSIAGKSMLN